MPAWRQGASDVTATGCASDQFVEFAEDMFASPQMAIIMRTSMAITTWTSNVELSNALSKSSLEAALPGIAYGICDTRGHPNILLVESDHFSRKRIVFAMIRKVWDHEQTILYCSIMSILYYIIIYYNLL